MSILGCFFKGIQLAGVVCFGLRSWNNTNPITQIASRTFPYQPCHFHVPRLIFMFACVHVGSKMRKVSCWSLSVASFPLKRITVAHLHQERR